jgi:hypothetical protein
MKNGFSSATTLSGRHRPPLCHLDRSVPGFPTSRCWQRPRVRLSVERAACRSPTPRVSTGNPGERSGEICGSVVRSWECFSTEESWAFGPTQGDEKRLLYSNDCRWRHCPSLCHLDRSAAKWRDLRSLPGNVFRQSEAEGPSSFKGFVDRWQRWKTNSRFTTAATGLGNPFGIPALPRLSNRLSIK